jgi:hypothetical protein
VLRKRLDDSPVAPLKLASGCDRRCSFCAIPSFRGSFVSRRPSDVMAEARWLAQHGVRELVLVSENSTSYGKDLGDLRLLETLLPELAALDGLSRVRLSYLQPAEMRPTLVDVLTGTPGVAAYFDMSFQHASGPVLRRMRRFGDTDRFLALLDQIRAGDPTAAVRSNVIVGFPGETDDDVDELERFLLAARLDTVGVFGYSDEDGTEAETLPDHLPQDVVDERVHRLQMLVEELTAQRAEDRIGEVVEVLVESVDGGSAEGRSAGQAPEVDGTTTLVGLSAGCRSATSCPPAWWAARASTWWPSSSRRTCWPLARERSMRRCPATKERARRRLRSGRVAHEPRASRRARGSAPGTSPTSSPSCACCSSRSSRGCCCTTTAPPPATGWPPRWCSASPPTPTASTATWPAAGASSPASASSPTPSPTRP